MRKLIALSGWAVLGALLLFAACRSSKAQMVCCPDGRCSVPQRYVRSEPVLVIWYHPEDPAWRQISGQFVRGGALREAIEHRVPVRFRNLAEPPQAQLARQAGIRGLTFELAGHQYTLEQLLGHFNLSLPAAPPEDTALPGASPRQTAEPAVTLSEADIQRAVRSEVTTSIEQINVQLDAWNTSLGEWESAIDANSDAIVNLNAKHDALRQDVIVRLDQLLVRIEQLEQAEPAAASSLSLGELSRMKSQLQALAQQRVLIVDGGQGIVVADETYEAGEPIVIDRRKLVKDRNVMSQGE